MTSSNAAEPSAPAAPIATPQVDAAELLSDEWPHHLVYLDWDKRFGVARHLLNTLAGDGWRLIPPDNYPGLCQTCKTVVEPGTEHRPFNGNQMFACEIHREPPTPTGDESGRPSDV